jgi:hypothetical protein
VGRADGRLGRLRVLRLTGPRPPEGLRAAHLARRPLHAHQRRPACRSCNASKCNDEVTGWLRRKKLDERAFLVRHHELLAALRERYAVEPEPA